MDEQKYRALVCEMVHGIHDLETLIKIYSYVKVKYRRMESAQVGSLCVGCMGAANADCDECTAENGGIN